MQPLPPVTEETVRMRWEGITDHGLRLFLMDLASSSDRIIMAVGGKPVLVSEFRIESISVRDGQLKVAASGEGLHLSIDARGEAFVGDSFPSGKLEGTVTLTPLAMPKYATPLPVVFFGWQREGFTAALQALKEAAEQKAQETKAKPAPSASAR
jgi:hypothetical protein